MAGRRVADPIDTCEIGHESVMGKLVWKSLLLVAHEVSRNRVTRV
jgi:hypothetical protein